MKPTFFASPSELRQWFVKHHATAQELLVGYHRKVSGRPTITWPESVAEALCFGWIDGIRRRIDDERYTIRFTPRRRGSSWSAMNIRMVQELEAAGRMMPAGRAAFESRKSADPAGYSYERRGEAVFDERRLKRFKKNKAAWAFFEAQPPGYRKTITWWVMSAKQEDTRDRRLAKLIASSAAGKRVT